jgi:hypothetical protein
MNEWMNEWIGCLSYEKLWQLYEIKIMASHGILEWHLKLGCTGVNWVSLFNLGTQVISSWGSSPMHEKRHCEHDKPSWSTLDNNVVQTEI